MAPPTLSYGLNLAPKKSQLSTGPSAPKKRKKTIFDSDSEDDGKTSDARNDEEITTLGGLDPVDSNSASVNLPRKKQHKAPLNALSESAGRKDFTNLSALHSSHKHAQEASSIDPSVYEYDEIYDSIHSKPTKPSGSTAATSGPKYMTSLLRSAEVRKRDQLRARDKLLAREREAEGDEFADKEKFVTTAYKAQQEEVKRMEAEEAVREKEEEEKRKNGLGMTSFYKDMLEKDEKRHEEVVKAAEEAVRTKGTKNGKENEGAEEERSAAQIAADLNARGANIIVNDEGEVVDKRQLLSAGLNVAPKPKQTAARNTPAAESLSRDSRQGRYGAVGSARAQQRARQTEMLAMQFEERVQKEQEEEDTRAKELAEKNKSKKTESDVMSAKERYLARKREKEREKELENAK